MYLLRGILAFGNIFECYLKSKRRGDGTIVRMAEATKITPQNLIPVQ